MEKNKEKPDDPFKPYGATPGHGIEWARLVTQWALSSSGGKPAGWRDVYIEAAEQLFCRAVNDAWNVDGAPGIVYTTDWDGRPCVHDRMHWTVADHVNGSWFHQLDRENHLIGTVWPGKSDLYHALQSMLIPYLRVDKSIAAAVKEK